MNDPKGGVAKVMCPTFEAMGQIPVFHRTYFLFSIFCGNCTLQVFGPQKVKA